MRGASRVSEEIATLRVAAMIALTLALAGGAQGAAQRSVPAVTVVRCPIAAPDGSRMECLRLRVPENRVHPTGKELSLLVLRFRSTAAHPAADPVLWLAGGPGGSAVALTTRPTLHRADVAPLLARRDVIVLEQRGTLYSRPALTCPARESDEACLARLTREGNDLRAYTSAASADDIEALRQVLHISRWNVLGESYGTRVAQTLIRRHPGHLRSVVLDSVVSIADDTVADSSAEAAGAFERLFSACAADPGCNTAYGGLEATLRRAYDTLERRPLQVRGRAFGASYAFELDGPQLVRWVYTGMYETALIPLLPRAITAASQGQSDPVWHAIASNLEVGISLLLARGVHRAVNCNEEVPFTNLSRIAATDAANPGVAPFFSGRRLFELCKTLPARHPNPVENRAVASSVPTLLLTGQLDPVTPPSEGGRVARHLSHSFFYEFPGLGHWVNPVHACPRRIMLAFLDRPTQRPDASCVADMRPPAWAKETAHRRPETPTAGRQGATMLGND